MHVPFSGLPSAPTAVSGMMPFGCCRLRLADDRLERDLRELVGELLLAQEVEQRRIAVDRRLVEVAADRDPAPVGDLPDVLEDPVERALAAAQRPHPVVRVAIAVERDLDAVQRRAASADPTTSGVSSSPLVMMLSHLRRRAPGSSRPQPLGQVVHRPAD